LFVQFFRWGFCRYGNGIGPDYSFFRLRKRLRLLFARIIPNPFPKYKSPLGAPKIFFSVKRDSAARSSRAAEKRFFAIPVSRTAGIRDAEIVENVIDQKEKASLPAAIGKKEKKQTICSKKLLTEPEKPLYHTRVNDFIICKA